MTKTSQIFFRYRIVEKLREGCKGDWHRVLACISDGRRNDISASSQAAYPIVNAKARAKHHEHQDQTNQSVATTFVPGE
jgi:hypothetical protein